VTARQAPQSDLKLPRWARVADALTIILAALTFWARMFGGIRFYVGELRISATSVWRLVFETAAVYALRHVLVPREPLADRIRQRLARIADVAPTLKTVVPVFVVTRISVLLIGYVAVTMIGYPGGKAPWRLSDSEFQNLPGRWDTGWYIGIAVDGYRWTRRVEDQQNLNFFPALPMAMRGASRLLSRTYSIVGVRTAWAGVFISLTAFLIALLYLYRFTRARFGPDTAAATIAFLSTYPFALFFSAAYSEALFLLGSVAAFIHLRRGQLVQAGLWGLLTGLVRPNGCLLSIPLAVLVVMQWRTESQNDHGARWVMPSWTKGIQGAAAAAMPIAGMLIYSFAAYRMTGRPFVWAELQRTAWGRRPQGLDEALFEPLQTMAEIGFVEYLARWPSDAFNLLAAMFAIVSIWPVIRLHIIAVPVLCVAWPRCPGPVSDGGGGSVCHGPGHRGGPLLHVAG
jgi:hypothetical protein